MTTERTLLIVAHGQPSEPDPPEAHLIELARNVAEHLPGWRVRGATMAKPGALETATKDLGPGALVYPFFMADGWFTQTALPQRLTGCAYNMLTPFGLNKGLPDLAAQWLREQTTRRGWTEAQTRVVLAAHGSGRSDRPARAAWKFADALTSQSEFDQITCGFVEQEPKLAIAAHDLGDQVLCLPYFAVAGDHVRDDIPNAMAEAGFRGAVLPVLGDHPGVPALIAATAQEA